MDYNLRIHVGDEFLIRATMKEWADELGLKEWRWVYPSDDFPMEELMFPMFYEPTLFVFLNPKAETLNKIENVLGRLPEDKGVGVLVESCSVDGRLKFYKEHTFDTEDVGYFLSSDGATVRQIINQLAPEIDAAAARELMRRVPLVRQDTINAKGAKTSSLVFNMGRIVSEVEKLQIYSGGETVSKPDVEALVKEGYVSDSWGILDALFAGNFEEAVRIADGIIVDQEHSLMFVGLLSSEMRIGILVSHLKSRYKINDAWKLSRMLQNNPFADKYFIDDENGEEKKQKLAPHAYRIKKMIDLLEKGIPPKVFVQGLMDCLQCSKDLRSRTPFRSLIYPLFFDISEMTARYLD